MSSWTVEGYSKQIRKIKKWPEFLAICKENKFYIGMYNYINEEYCYNWIKDIVEYTETKMDSMYRAPGKPNTLVGTTGYRKYVEKMTPGSEWGKQFINKYKAKKR